MLRVLDAFAAINKDMPLQMVRAFLLATPHETDEAGKGASVAELSEYAKQSLSVTSAHVLGLSARNRYREEGYKLVRQDLDPDDPRVRRVTLTPKGVAFLHRLLRLWW